MKNRLMPAPGKDLCAGPLSSFRYPLGAVSPCNHRLPVRENAASPNKTKVFTLLSFLPLRTKLADYPNRQADIHALA